MRSVVQLLSHRDQLHALRPGTGTVIINIQFYHHPQRHNESSTGFYQRIHCRFIINDNNQINTTFQKLINSREFIRRYTHRIQNIFVTGLRKVTGFFQCGNSDRPGPRCINFRSFTAFQCFNMRPQCHAVPATFLLHAFAVRPQLILVNEADRGHQSRKIR